MTAFACTHVVAHNGGSVYFCNRGLVNPAIVLGILLSLSLPAVVRAKDIRIATPSKSLVFLPLYVGVTQGHFKREGFNPQVILSSRVSQ